MRWTHTIYRRMYDSAGIVRSTTLPEYGTSRYNHIRSIVTQSNRRRCRGPEVVIRRLPLSRPAKTHFLWLRCEATRKYWSCVHFFRAIQCNTQGALSPPVNSFGRYVSRAYLFPACAYRVIILDYGKYSPQPPCFSRPPQRQYHVGFWLI